MSQFKAHKHDIHISLADYIRPLERVLAKYHRDNHDKSKRTHTRGKLKDELELLLTNKT